MLSQLTVDALRAFQAAAAELNFRAAARRVALSPSAFGSQLSKLEQLLGTTLFERTTRRVQLTAAGRALLPRCEQALAALEECVKVTAQKPAVFDLVIGTRFELGLSWLTPNLRSLARAVPQRTINLAFGDSADLLARTQLGQLDATITSARFDGRRFEHVDLHEERYVLVGSSALERKPLTDHCLLDADTSLPLFRYYQAAAPDRASLRFARVERLGAIAAIRQRVLDGAGIAVLPQYFVADDIRRKKMKILVGPNQLLSDWFRLIWNKNHARPDQLIELATTLRALPLR